MLFQLPPYLKCDVALLKGFYHHCLPRSAFRLARIWFTDEVYEAMRAANVALCQAESEKLETPDVQTADFAYLRLRKQDYSAKQRKALTAKVAGLANKTGDAASASISNEDARGAIAMRKRCWHR